jgi:predicted PurR-regulated permease PerM
MPDTESDTTRTILKVLFVLILVVSFLWVLGPFLGAIVWATTIVVATWPFLAAAEARLKFNRSVTVALMTLVLLCVLVIPLILTVGTITSNAEHIATWIRSLANFKMGPPPETLANLPLAGEKLVEAWESIAALGIEGMVAKTVPYASGVFKWVLAQLGNFGFLLVQFLLTVILAAALYANGEFVTDQVLKFGSRLGGASGERMVHLAGQTIRGVALGVVVTALAQSILGGSALALAGVPFAAVLSAVMLVLCIAQIGPVLILLPAVIWLYWSGSSGWGTFLLVMTVIVGTMDNFLRPFLIKKGGELPLFLIIAGVIGGLLAFGLIGIFVGPVILTVANALLRAWIDEGPGGKGTEPRTEPAEK